MSAVSKAQQKFFGIVRAIQKGEMAPTTPETAKAAADMKKSDVKKFASTKHKGLPQKKKISEKIDLTDRKQMRRITDAEKKHKEQDKRMKFGKFYEKAKEARDRLRPGEVKKFNKQTGEWESNKD